jgi:hypothetical protein
MVTGNPKLISRTAVGHEIPPSVQHRYSTAVNRPVTIWKRRAADLGATARRWQHSGLTFGSSLAPLAYLGTRATVVRIELLY